VALEEKGREWMDGEVNYQYIVVVITHA